MPLANNTIDILAASMTREELVICWKDAQAQADAALDKLKEVDKQTAELMRELEALKGRVFGITSATEPT